MPPVLMASRTASASRSSISSSSSVLSANPAVSTASASGSRPACSRSRLRASASGPFTRFPIRSARGAAEARRRRAAARSPRWKQMTAAMPRSLQAAACSGQAAVSTGHRFAPPGANRPIARCRRSSWPSAVCACASRTTAPSWRARRSPCRAAPKAFSYRSRLARLTALLICSSSRRSVRAGSASVTASARSNKRQRVGHLALHGGHDRQHVQGPGDRPVVAASVAACERGRGELAGLFQLAMAAVRAGAEHEQPRPVAGRDPGRIQGPVQRGQRLVGLPDEDAALRERPVQVNEHVGIGDMRQRLVGHLLGSGRVTNPVEGVGEPAHQTVVVGRATAQLATASRSSSAATCGA